MRGAPTGQQGSSALKAHSVHQFHPAWGLAAEAWSYDARVIAFYISLFFPSLPCTGYFQSLPSTLPYSHEIPGKANYALPSLSFNYRVEPNHMARSSFLGCSVVQFEAACSRLDGPASTNCHASVQRQGSWVAVRGGISITTLYLGGRKGKKKKGLAFGRGWGASTRKDGICRYSGLGCRETWAASADR